MSSKLQDKIDNITDERLLDIAENVSSPANKGKKARHIYANQIMCFTAFTLMSFWQNGPRALYLVLTSVIVSIVVDYVCCRMCGKEYTHRDLSNVSAGMCVALLTPASIPYALVAAGAALTIGIKHVFGGKDNYIFNPTAVAIAFMIISYPEKMLFYPAVGEWLPVVGESAASLTTGLENVLIKLGRVQEMSALDILLGLFPGPMGTTHIAVILVCAVCLLARRCVSVVVTLSSLAVILIIAIFFPLYDNFLNTLAYQLVGGYMLFGILFLANDPQTLPKTHWGQLFYGILLGAITVIFRYFGKVEGSFVFGLLAANALSLRMDLLAEIVLGRIRAFPGFMKKRLSTFETIRETAKTTGDVADLSDTQEIEITPTNYDMPPIDNKVTKINRKKPNLLKKTREIIGEIAEKSDNLPKAPAPELPEEPDAPELEFKKVLKLTVLSVTPVIEKLKKLFTVKPTPDAEAEKTQQPEPPPAETAESKTVKGGKKGKKSKTPQKESSKDNQIEVVDFEEVAEFTKETGKNKE